MVTLGERKSLAMTNFNSLPNTKNLFGEEWFKENLEKSKLNDSNQFEAHPFVWLLSNSGFCEPVVKSHDLEINLGILKEQPKIGREIEKAKISDQFWQTLSEIEILAVLKRSGVLLEIEPKIDGKTPDALIKFCNRNFSLEVLTPQLGGKLSGEDGGGFVRNRLQGGMGLIAEKIKQIPYSISTILVINRAFSELSDLFLETAMDGSFAIQFIADNNRKATEGVTREEDGLVTISDGDRVSASVIYKREFKGNNKLISNYLIKPFDKARQPLLANEIEKLGEIFSMLEFESR